MGKKCAKSTKFHLKAPTHRRKSLVYLKTLKWIEMNISIVIIGILLATIPSAFSCRCAWLDPPQYVCGSNGVTYNGPCFLGCAPPWPRGANDPCLTVIYQGECTTKCDCNDTCDYLCDSDGNTHGNMCAFNCAKLKYPNLTVAHPGRCWMDRPNFKSIILMMINLF